jgi:hypothetical protein
MPQGPLPATAADITPEWLTSALADRYPGVRVAAVEVVHTTEATNAHARLRIVYHEQAGAPTAVFCKLPPRDEYRREHIIESGMGRREAYFYRDMAPVLRMRTPAAHVTGYDESDGTFLLMIEDLADTGCEVSDGTWGIPPDSAAGALEDLAQLHVRFEDPKVREADAPWVTRRKARPGNTYGTTLLQFGLDHHRDRLSDEFATIAQLYIDRDLELSELWLEGPTTLLHGDAHIGNLFVDNGRTGFLDWGLMTLSTPLRDVSYFLNMAMNIDDRRRHEESLLRHYLDAKDAMGTTQPFTFDEAWAVHRIHAAYTVVACCQIVTFPENATTRRRTFANAFLARSEAAIADLASRAALKEAGIAGA